MWLLQERRGCKRRRLQEGRVGVKVCTEERGGVLEERRGNCRKKAVLREGKGPGKVLLLV